MAMDVEEKEQLGFPYWKSVRRRFGPESPFFASGNIERELLAKQVALDLTEDDKHQLQNLVTGEGRVFFCPIVSCGTRLTSLENFEDHYNARHTAFCQYALESTQHHAYSAYMYRKHTIPSFRLKLHVAMPWIGCDDRAPNMRIPLFSYECLVEGCGLKLKSYKGRQQHLVDKHKFPVSFEFFKKGRPSKKQRQKSQCKQATHKSEEASCMDIENESIDGLVSAVSRLSTTDSSPSSVSFGRRHTRGLTFVPRAVQRDKRPDST
ncbi:hypothetical protein CJ030_MR0G008548 [Morella rubra]|uniref:C2H2-type domain-containing protein n=1 Tax=Morella rubra TaxID=262757 RepID=A0A6A1UIU3_9ROSI|nr:hypothetical protein CJ030_MR0G008548 [Morella rubra]